MDAKYIVVDKVKPVIFSSCIEHKTEANGRNVTSAGFIGIWAEEGQGEGILQLHCYGESTSLGGLRSKPHTDTKLIKAMLNI